MRILTRTLPKGPRLHLRIFDDKHELKIVALDKTSAVTMVLALHFGDPRTVTFPVLYFRVVVTDAALLRHRSRLVAMSSPH